LANGNGQSKVDDKIAEEMIAEKRSNLQESKSKTNTFKAQNQQQSDKKVKTSDSTVLALVGVIVGLFVGIIVYCIVSYYRKTQNEKLVRPRKYIVKTDSDIGLREMRKDESVPELP